MISFVLWMLIFCISTTISITLIGDRNLIAGNLLDWTNILKLLLNWKFITAIVFAAFSRVSFIMINNSLLKIPHLAGSSTSITTFATSISLIFVLTANYYFLDEKLSFIQIAGAAVVLLGIFLMTKQ